MNAPLPVKDDFFIQEVHSHGNHLKPLIELHSSFAFGVPGQAELFRFRRSPKKFAIYRTNPKNLLLIMNKLRSSAKSHTGVRIYKKNNRKVVRNQSITLKRHNRLAVATWADICRTPRTKFIQRESHQKCGQISKCLLMSSSQYLSLCRKSLLNKIY